MSVPNVVSRCELVGCGMEYAPTRYDQRFCSQECGYLSQIASQVEKVREKKKRNEEAKKALARTNCSPMRSSALGTLSAVDKHRRLDCKSYDACLGLASACEWNGFVCDNCDGYEYRPMPRSEAAKLSNLGHAIEIVPGLLDE